MVMRIIWRVLGAGAMIVASWVVSFLGIVACGELIGIIFNPEHSHSHHQYACACDEAPVLTEPQAIAVGIAVFLLVNLGIWLLLRRIKFSKVEQVIVILISILTNWTVCAVATKIMCTQVTG